MTKRLTIGLALLSAFLSGYPVAGWALDSGTITINAVILSASNCRFIPPKSADINFGILDPTNPVNVTVSASVIIRCSGSDPLATFGITDDDGLHETGLNANRMQHTVIAGQYIPYSLSYLPTSATIPRNTNQTITITGTLNGANYQNAIAGIFTDVVTLTVAP
jgi:spore coat protein U-like protein